MSANVRIEVTSSNRSPMPSIIAWDHAVVGGLGGNPRFWSGEVAAALITAVASVIEHLGPLSPDAEWKIAKATDRLYAAVRPKAEARS